MDLTGAAILGSRTATTEGGPPRLCGATSALTDAEVAEVVRRAVAAGPLLTDEPFASLRTGAVCDLFAGHAPAPHASIQALMTRDGIPAPWLRWDEHGRVVTWLLDCRYQGNPEFSSCLLYEGHPPPHQLWDEDDDSTAPSWLRRVCERGSRP
jgi:hypothetical protein